MFYQSISLALLVSCATLPSPNEAYVPSRPPVNAYGFTVWEQFVEGFRVEVIITPQGKRLVGAPFGLNCDLSYSCLVIGFTEAAGQTYLIAASAVYHYRPASDDFKLDSDFSENYSFNRTDWGFEAWTSNQRFKIGALIFQAGRWEVQPQLEP